MILPRSASATSSSMTVSSPSSYSSIKTSPLASTIALAMYSIMARGLTLGSIIRLFLNSAPEFARVGLSDRNGRSRRGESKQFPDAVRTLGAFRNPMLNALPFQVESSRIGARIIGAHHLHRAAIASPLLLNHHHSVIR